jgi:excisionase family DNA binding protein
MVKNVPGDHRDVATKQLSRTRMSTTSESVASPAQITPRLLTIPAAAAYASVAIWAIRQAIWSRELRAARIGRRLVIDRADLDAFIDRKLREATA